MLGWHVHIMIDVWTNHGESRLYGNGETDLKLDTVNAVAKGKAIPISFSGTTKKGLMTYQWRTEV